MNLDGKFKFKSLFAMKHVKYKSNMFNYIDMIQLKILSKQNKLIFMNLAYG